jgi:hypothetical protein
MRRHPPPMRRHRLPKRLRRQFNMDEDDFEDEFLIVAVDGGGQTDGPTAPTPQQRGDAG